MTLHFELERGHVERMQKNRFPTFALYYTVYLFIFNLLDGNRFHTLRLSKQYIKI
jgi:hypothetical protein